MITLRWLCLPLLLFFFDTHAQNAFSDRSRTGLVYRLTDDEAAHIYRKNPDFEEKWLHTQADTFHGARPTRPLPPGHYLLVSARQEHLFAEMLSVNTLHVYIVEDGKGLSLSILDAAGAMPNDAVVRLNGKKVTFEPDSRLYRLSKRCKGGFLRVQTGTETLFQQIDTRANKPVWRRKLRRSFTQGAGRPFLKAYYAVYRQYRYAKFRLKGYSLTNRNRLPGYIAFSKPAYLPGDTLSLKAWVTKKNGRPRRKPLHLLIENGGLTLVDRHIKPQSPGNFIFNLPLGDSLELDDYIEVALRGKTGYLHSSLYYEDYQLDEVDYKLEASRYTFQREDTVAFDLSARYANGQAAPDCSVELLLIKNTIKQSFYAPMVAIPDTLWRYSTTLGNDAETRIEVPDSIWPEADLDVVAKAVFVNSAGEQQNKSDYFNVARAPARIDLQVKNGRLSASWKPGTAPRDSAVLTEIWKNRNTTQRRIALPFQMPVSGEAEQYKIRLGDVSAKIDLSNRPEQHGVTYRDVRSLDTLWYALRNPARLPVFYSISRGETTIREGLLEDTLLVFAEKPANDHYQLNYHFLWAGSIQNQTKTLFFREKLLTIEQEQPATVRPGDQIQVKIKVKDAHGRPVPGADLTAGAYNAEFDRKEPFTAPVIPITSGKLPFYYDCFDPAPLQAPEFRVPLERKWHQALELDSVLYYRIRYRGSNGFYTESLPVKADSSILRSLPDLPRAIDSFYLHKPQFAVYVIRKNRLEPAQLVYCNGKLVYYSGVTDQPRYSFFAQPGHNSITVRTRDAVYTLDSIWLEKGRKLEIAINADSIFSGKKPFTLHYAAQPDTLSLYEQHLLRSTMLQWRNPAAERSYFWEYADNIHCMEPSGQATHIIGPFPPLSVLKHLNGPDYFTHFQFEPGFEYEITPQRERLYESRWPVHTRLSYFLNFPQNPGNFALGLQDIRPPEIRKVPVLPFTTTSIDRPGAASLQFVFEKKDTALLAVFLRSDTGIIGPYRGPVRKLEGLSPGRYRLVLYTENGWMTEQALRLGRDTTLLVNMQTAVFRPAGETERIEQLFKVEEAAGKRPEPAHPYHFSRWTNTTGFSVIQGTITDNTGEELIGATVKVLQNNVFVAGTIADFNGHYRLQVPAGTYNIEVSYTGYLSKQLTGVVVLYAAINRADVTLDAGAVLQAVEIVAYKVPLIQQDQTTSGKTITSDMLYEMPTRPVSAILSSESVVGADDAPPYLDEASPGPRSDFRDVGFWKPDLRTDRKGEAYFQTTLPDNLTAWNTFTLAAAPRRRAGYTMQQIRTRLPLSARLSVPRFAVAGDRFDIIGRSQNDSGDSLNILSEFRLDGSTISRNSQRIGTGLTEWARVETPADADSLQLEYYAQSGQDNDGEARALPLLPRGLQEAEGQFWVLDGDTTLTLSIDPAKGLLRLRAENNTLELLLDDIRYLREYPYDCNEQTASRLLALLLEKSIRTQLGQAFEHEKDIRVCLQKLRTAQWTDGSWGWWPGNPPDAWMSAYVCNALLHAQQQGYTTLRDNTGKALGWLQHRLPTMQPDERRYALRVLMENGVHADHRNWVSQLDSLPARSLGERLGRMRLRQLCDEKPAYDSLKTLLQPTVGGGLYCGDPNPHWYERREQNTLLAYDIARDAGWTDLRRGIERYWLESRRPDAPRNTIETAQILHRLLPALLKPGETLQPAALEIDGRRVDKFPFAAASDSLQHLQLRKTGAGPLFFSAWQERFNPAPQPKENLFRIVTRLEQNGRPADTLRRGEPAELVVQVEVRQAAEYLMLSVPIPAGCSYGDKTAGSWLEAHRAYYRDRTTLFFRELPVGKYTFRIALEPRFSGHFTLLPAQMEQMYFPVLNGQNGLKTVEIR